MATITLTNLCFAYDGGEELFSDVSLQIDTRWKLGLIGRNGRGKTTLLKLLLGQLACEGRIDTPVPLDYFPFTVRHPDRSVLEAVREIAEFEDWQLRRELSLLDLPGDLPDRTFETLSGGEQTKVLLAAMFLNENRFLLLDEPTNHLDAKARETVGDYLKRKNGFILVSHDRTLLDTCVDHILSINRADLELSQGCFSTWQQTWEIRQKHEESENRRLRKEVRRLKESARQSSEWSQEAEKGKYGNGPVDRGFIGSKAARKMKQAKGTEARRQKAIDEKSNLFKNKDVDENLSISPLRFHSSRILDLSGLSVRYGSSPLFSNFSLSVDAGDRIALAGKNGSGKSSLLKLIAGEPVSFEGRRSVPGSLRIAHLPQDTSLLRGGLREFLEQRALDESLFKAILHKLGFAREDYENELTELSEGQKKKILLAGNLCDRAHLYLWDEPLNFIDVISRMQIERLILEYRPTMIFVEHDRAFVDAVATKVVRIP